MQKKSQKPKSKPDYEQLGRMLENIYDSGYIDKNRALKMSFMKGVAAGLGGVIGATVVVALLLWTLTFFDQVPFLGPLSQRVQDTVESSQ